MEPSGVEKILRAKPARLPEPAFLAQKVAELERLAAMGEARAVVRKLCEIVLTFQPVGMNSCRVGPGVKGGSGPGPI